MPTLPPARPRCRGPTTREEVPGVKLRAGRFLTATAARPASAGTGAPAHLRHFLHSRPRDLTPSAAIVAHGSRFWAITFFPASRSASSKTFTQDDSVHIGQPNPRRAWLGQVAAALYTRPRDGPMFSVSLTQLETAFATAARALELPSRVPHQLRHGGPSADAATGVTSEFAIQVRGRWASQRSVARYMKAGRYSRMLAQLSSSQRAKATQAESVLARSLPNLLRAATRKRPRP